MEAVPGKGKADGLLDPLDHWTLATELYAVASGLSYP